MVWEGRIELIRTERILQHLAAFYLICRWQQFPLPPYCWNIKLYLYWSDLRACMLSTTEDRKSWQLRRKKSLLDFFSLIPSCISLLLTDWWFCFTLQSNFDICCQYVYPLIVSNRKMVCWLSRGSGMNTVQCYYFACFSEQRSSWFFYKMWWINIL